MTFDEFLKTDRRGDTVTFSDPFDGGWIAFHKNTITLDGEFTLDELKKIIAAFECTSNSSSAS